MNDLERALSDAQQDNGSFNGNAYSTGMSLLAITVPSFTG